MSLKRDVYEGVRLFPTWKLERKVETDVIPRAEARDGVSGFHRESKLNATPEAPYFWLHGGYSRGWGTVR